MPRAFDITATTSSVQLGASGQGEVSFTVSNKLGTGVTVRATVEPTGDTRPEWVSFPNGMERTLSPDGTAVIPVRVAVPPGTSPGTYGFNLVVASVSNPDEHYARGPSVAFTAAPAPVPVKKPFPWWLVALAAGVLIIIGGVVAILSARGDKQAPGLGQACAKEEPKCGPDLACGTSNVCLGAKGFKGCERGEQCATNRCEEGTCEELVALSGACNSADDCNPPLACHEGVCRGLAGFQGCDKVEQCATGRCEASKCQEQVTLGDTCDSTDDCRSPLTCHQTFCLMPVGQKCTHPSQCVSGECQSQVCARGAVVCPRCPMGTLCFDGRCQAPVIRRDHRILQELQVAPRRTIPAP
jgi:hypothetical protein